MIKKLLTLSLSLILSASIIAEPLDTFYSTVNKINQALKEKTIEPEIAATTIHAAREELYKTGGLAFKKSPQIKRRIDQIKKDNPTFAVELENIETAFAEKKEEAKRTPPIAPAPTVVPASISTLTSTTIIPTVIHNQITAPTQSPSTPKPITEPITITSYSRAESWRALERAYTEVQKIFSTKETTIKEMTDALESFKTAIKNHQSSVGKIVIGTVVMQRRYNAYLLELTNRLLTRSDATDTKETIATIDSLIDTLFTDLKGQIISDKSDPINKTKDELKAETRQNIIKRKPTPAVKPADHFGEALEAFPGI